jgi:outer membrane protein assembly factor BamB
LWRRELGDGYSSMVVDGDLLYALYRSRTRPHGEYASALDVRTGETVWNHEIPSPLDQYEGDDSSTSGQGPNSTPLIHGDRLFTMGSHAVLTCFDKRTGAVRWRHDLIRDFGHPPYSGTGYSPSPIAFGNLVIVPVEDISSRALKDEATGDRRTLFAFDQETGEVVWATGHSRYRFASPIRIRFKGKDQLVLPSWDGLAGMDPENGDLVWRHPLEGSIVTPVWNGEDLLFYSSGGTDAPGVAVRLEDQSGRIVPRELWCSDEAAIWQPTPVRLGDYLYGSTSSDFLCVHLPTGKVQWTRKGFPMAACIHGDEKLILLDEDGRLTLAEVSPEGMRVLSQSKVVRKYAFTVPVLAGKTLYIRDRRHIMALDLGAQD